MYLIHYTLSVLNVTTAEGSSPLRTGAVEETTDRNNSATALYSCGRIGATTRQAGQVYPAPGDIHHSTAAIKPGPDTSAAC